MNEEKFPDEAGPTSSPLCEACLERTATVHLTTTTETVEADQKSITQEEHHFCPQCADDYFARTPGMNSSRGLICLSDFYRSKLYDLLEATHPEAFDNRDTAACQRACDLMRPFLRQHLAKDQIEVHGDAFEMLCSDFFCSHHFYSRMDDYNRRKGLNP